MVKNALANLQQFTDLDKIQTTNVFSKEEEK